MGILHERLLAGGKISDETDEKFRNRIASQCAAYETLRDAAFALKHGELTGKKQRVVRRPDQLQAYSAALDKAVFDRSAFQTEDLIWVEAGNSSKRADELIFEVMTLAEGLLKQHGF